jgi:glucokinase
MEFAIGVDLGGTNLRVAAVDDAGRLLEKRVMATDAASRGYPQVLDVLSDAIRLLAQAYRDRGLLRGVGVGVPGILDARTGILRDSPTLPGWRDVPVREALEGRLGTRIILDNDANVAAVGEHWCGAGRGHPDLCILTLGTGIGGAIVFGGQPWRGKSGMAGEIGHLPLRPDEGPPCACGGRGCLQQYASASAVRRMVLEAVMQGRAPSLAPLLEGNPGDIALRTWELATAGDAPACEVFRQVGVALGIALAGLVNVLNLPLYVVGGGVSCAWDLFAPALFAELRRRSFVYAATGDTTRVVRAEMPHDAGLYGAARLAFLNNAG